MAKLKRHLKLVEKSVAAMLSGIEIYNKPDFKYREEIFSILFVNAWELLLKAKILKNSEEILSSIQVAERLKTKTGQKIKRFYPKKNRSGNPLTIDIYKAIEVLKLPKPLKANLEAIVEIRDNSIHFRNEDKFLNKRIQEICTASMKSYLDSLKNWFVFNIASYNFYLIPLSFFHPYEIDSYSVNTESQQEKNLLKYLKLKERSNPYIEGADHNFALVLATKFEKGTGGLPVKIGKKGTSIVVSEESLFKTRYVIKHDDLIKKLKDRYNDFKSNNKFWTVLKPMKEDAKYCKYSYLDPVKKVGGKKPFYCSEVFTELDKHYTKK